MAGNHIQKGDVLDWNNDSGADVVSGQLVAVGDKVGIALGDIADGEVGRVAVAEVWEVPKKAVAVTVGQSLYLDVSEKKVTGTPTDNVAAGYAFAPAATDDGTVLLKING